MVGPYRSPAAGSCRLFAEAAVRAACHDVPRRVDMEFKQFYLGCLAQASYLVGSEGEAAIVDPSRDVEHYVEEARGRGLRITQVIETHVHADFVSGHAELAAKTG